MTPDPTLTDEELDTIETVVERVRHLADAIQMSGDVPRVIAWTLLLVAELRASRAEVERLSKLAQSNRVEADAMGEIAREWEAEVDRLRKDLGA